MRRSLPHSLLLALVLAGCSDSGPRDLSEYYRWVNDPERGLMKRQVVNGVVLTVKYLPPEYLAHQYLQGENGAGAEKRDSLLRAYRNSLCFMLTIAAADSSGDVMTRGIGSYQEFNDRAVKMNFEMGNYLTLRADGHEYRPALALMENTYGLRPQRDVVIVFARDAALGAAKTLDLAFEDAFFDTGISHFTFLGSDLQAVPEMPL